MDDKWVEGIDWGNGVVFVDMRPVVEAKRAAFEYEEQMAALKDYVEETSAEDLVKAITGYDVTELAEALQQLCQEVCVTAAEMGETISSFLRKVKEFYSQSTLSRILDALQDGSRAYESEKAQQRYWKSYRCPQHRKQNLRAFQNIICGYNAPLPQRNSRVMIRRTC